MREMHEASSLESEAEVKVWREGTEKAEGKRIKDGNGDKQSFSSAAIEQ